MREKKKKILPPNSGRYIHDHLALIKQQNDHIAQLIAKINEHEIENEKFKFARSMLYNGRRPGIKDGIGFWEHLEGGGE